VRVAFLTVRGRRSGQRGVVDVLPDVEPELVPVAEEPEEPDKGEEPGDVEPEVPVPVVCPEFGPL
jgi:hypothetical protein